MFPYSVLPIFAGVAVHIVYFNRFECHRHIHTIRCLSVVAAIFLQWIHTRLHGLWHAIVINTQIAFLFVAGAVLSTLIYRLFFNPLNRFPGPYLARLTDFWMSFHVGKSLDQYQKLDVLHKKYGPYVRTGANQLSIVDPNLIEPAYLTAQKSGVTKAGWYDFDWPARSLLSERSFHGHAKRRRMWAPAFSDKALRQYEAKVAEYNDKFMKRIDQMSSTQSCVNVSDLFGLYSFDVMGSLVFGEDYKMLQTNKKHHALELLTEGLAALGLSLPIWFFLFVKSIPWDCGGTRGFTSFCDAQVEKAVQKRRFSTQAIRKLSVAAVRKFSVASMRKISITSMPGAAFCGSQAEWTAQKKRFDSFCDAQVEQAVHRRRSVVAQKAPASVEDQRSILYWVLKTYGDRPNLEKDTFLQSDAKLLIIAGSDTTAATLTYLFYHLAQSQSDMDKIRDEIRGCDDSSDRDLRSCQHLNGAINEALRLHPPGPSGVHRTIPAGGLRVGPAGEEVYIPGGTNFNMPVYTVNHDESLYPQADSFIPERWYSRPELVKDKKAFIPFLAGSYSCLGKNLALTEIRTLTARVLMEYGVKFAPGEDGSRLLYKSKDHFTISLAPLDLVFEPISRKRALGSLGDSRPEVSLWRGFQRDSCIGRDIIPEETMYSWNWQL